MPDHIKFLLRHAAIGSAAAIVFAGLIFWFNIANLRHLVMNTAEGPLAFGVMTVLFAITFGSVQMGIRVMAMADDDGGSGGKRDDIPVDAMPIPVPSARAPQRRAAPPQDDLL